MQSSDNSVYGSLNYEEQKYLIHLYRANELGFSRISTTELSQRLQLHPSTVTNKLKMLKDINFENKKLIDYEKSYGVKLTHYGKLLGGILVRQVRLKELFLRSLGLNLVEISNEKEQTHFSDRVMSRIEESITSPFLQKIAMPKDSLRCPHGALIPDENGRVRNEMIYPLDYFPNAEEITIHRIIFSHTSQDHSCTLREIEQNSLYPGTRIMSLDNDLNKLTFLKIDTNEEIKLPISVANQIYCTDQNYNYCLPKAMIPK